MDLLAALVVTRVRVRVVIDSLERPLGILELHLLLLVAFSGNLLVAFPPLGWCAHVPRLLLLLLVELLHELPNLPTLLYAVAPRVVYQPSRTARIATGGLPRPLLASWATTPTGRCSNSDSGSSDQWLVVVTCLLLLPISISIFAAALSSGICFWLADLPYL
jgi:hypothetical protein